ncbi:MAG: MBL fold metallo-hydrolase [Candidatus Micrarchaeota archaeon]
MKKVTQRVFKLELGGYSCNSFFIPSLNAIVDPGFSSKSVLEKELNQASSSIDAVERVFLTHAHYDHAFNLKYFPEASVFLHEIALRKLERNDESAFFSETSEKPFIPEKTFVFASSKEFNGVRAFYTPGHCEDASCFLFEDCFFAGDTIFVDSLPRIFMPGGKNFLLQSYASLLKVNARVVCCGHNEEGEFKKELERSISELRLV